MFLSLIIVSSLLALGFGQEICPCSPPVAPDYMMVVGGEVAATKGKVEVVDLTGNGTTCQAVSDVDIDVFGVGITFDEFILVCGGLVDGTSTITDKCYKYTAGTSGTSPSWAEHDAKLTTPRKGAMAIQYSETHYWILGGTSDLSTELYDKESNTFTSFGVDLPDMGLAFSSFPERAMIMRVNSTHIAILGGNNDALDIFWVFNQVTQEWTQPPSYSYSKKFASAGMVTLSTGERVIVAVGSTANEKAEMFKFSTNAWTNIADLNEAGPFYKNAGALASGDAYLSVGGRIDTSKTDLDKVYNYDPTANSWSALSGVTLGMTRKSPILLPFPSSLCN